MSIAVGVCAIMLAANLNDSLDTFPIGFWNYAPIDVFDEAKIQEWQDAGMTLTMGPEYAATPENIVKMRKILGWAEARHIKVIVCDPRLNTARPLSTNYPAEAARVAEDFAGCPAAFGFHLLDEPDAAAFQGTCDGVQIVKAHAPHLHPFVNLLPWHPGVNTRVGFDDWGNYLDTFLKKSGADFLCYDCYSQMNPGRTGWPMYFKNLREYGAAAKRNGVPFWNTILSTGHFHYRCPSEDDIRWQFNTSIAYGAQGILYFFFYMRQPHDNYRLAPIDEFYDRTPVFESLKRTNKGFVKRYGRLFLELTLDKAMQYPEAAPGCALFEPDELLAKVETDGDRALIVSRFSDKQGRPWVAMVNNSTEESTLARVFIKNAKIKAYQMDWSNHESPAGVTVKGEEAILEHWLAPGQLEIYRIEP